MVGYTLSADIKIAVAEEGDYWFEIYIEDQLATKVPLRITHSKKFVDLEFPQQSEPQTPSGSP